MNEAAQQIVILYNLICSDDDHEEVFMEFVMRSELLLMASFEQLGINSTRKKEKQ